jgi:hypothetical protein
MNKIGKYIEYYLNSIWLPIAFPFMLMFPFTIIIVALTLTGIEALVMIAGILCLVLFISLGVSILGIGIIALLSLINKKWVKGVCFLILIPIMSLVVYMFLFFSIMAAAGHGSAHG